ncbi:MAG: hypothetical protein J5846_05185 [Desulfovibrio sp.]|nr:hypothetical protein [Desulfovibrio sp.]
MTYITKKIMQIVGIFFVLLTLLLLGQIDSIALQCTEAFFPGFGVPVCLGLVGLEAFAIYALYRSLFGRPSRLVLKTTATPEEREAFTREMRKRLARNPHILKANFDERDEDFLNKAMAHLDALADAEIRANGKKVFLGTALSQNGRLDALIVFFSLCRMVWRISAIYNQRPTAQEILSVCSTVSSSTFVAFSIEALDIPQTITETMNELVPSVAPAMAASSVPFLGSAIHVFTQSLIDGAANCLLAVRAGVITRRAYRFAMNGGEESLRRSCVKETAAMMVDISQEAVSCVVATLKKEFQDLSLASGRKLVSQAGTMTVNLGASAVQVVKEGVSNAAQGVANLALATTGQAVSAVKDGVSHSASLAGEAVDSMKEGITGAAQGVASFSQKTAETAVNVVKDGVLGTAELAGRAVDTVKEGVTGAAQGVASFSQKTAETAINVVKDGVLGTAELAGQAVDTVKEGVTGAAQGVASFTQKTAETAVNVVKDGVLGTAELAGRAVDTVKDGVTNAAEGLANFTQKTTGQAVNALKDGVALMGNGAEKMASAVKDGAGQMLSLGSRGLNEVQTKGRKLADFMSSTGRSVWQRVSGKKQD